MSSLPSVVSIAKPKRHLYQAKTSSLPNLIFSFQFAGVDPTLLDLLRDDYEFHTNASYDVLALGPADVNLLLTKAECQREDLRFDSVAIEDAEQVRDYTSTRSLFQRLGDFFYFLLGPVYDFFRGFVSGPLKR